MVKLTVKTLKGEKFQVDAEPSNTVAEVKGIVVSDYYWHDPWTAGHAAVRYP